MTAVVLYVQLHGLLVFGYRICRLPPIRDMGRSDTGCERRRLAENMGYPDPSEKFLALCANAPDTVFGSSFASALPAHYRLVSHLADRGVSTVSTSPYA